MCEKCSAQPNSQNNLATHQNLLGSFQYLLVLVNALKYHKKYATMADRKNADRSCIPPPPYYSNFLKIRTSTYQARVEMALILES